MGASLGGKRLVVVVFVSCDDNRLIANDDFPVQTSRLCSIQQNSGNRRVLPIEGQTEKRS